MSGAQERTVDNCALSNDYVKVRAHIIPLRRKRIVSGHPHPLIRVRIRDSRQGKLRGMLPSGVVLPRRKCRSGPPWLFLGPRRRPERGVDHRLGLGTLRFFNRSNGCRLRGRSFPPGFRQAVVLSLPAPFFPPFDLWTGSTA
jgi:hypothetical protein